MPAGDRLTNAVAALRAFEGSTGLTRRIAQLEYEFRATTRETIDAALAAHEVDETALIGALEIKRLAGQVNVAIHAVGILLALPTILDDGELVEELSLGAGNTGRDFDLVTNMRVAEFKFIKWRGGAEAIRQNGLFIDLFHLAEANTAKRRVVYLTELVHPLRFLQGGRALASVLSRNSGVADQFKALHGERYSVVREYWEDVKDRVELVDLSQLVPAFAALPAIDDGDADVALS